MTFGKVRHYGHVVAFRARTTMRAETSKTYLNFLWWVIDPVVTMAVFYVVFGVVLQRGVENFPVFLMVGLVAWQWFGNTVSSAMPSIAQAGSLVSQVRFPRVVLPLTVVVANSYKFLFVFAILLGFLWISGFPPSAAYFALPALVLLELLLVYGAATLAAAAMPLFPDLQYIIGNLLRALMLLSGVFYPISAIPAAFQPLFLANPMVAVIDAYRQVLMFQQWPSWENLSYSVIAACLVAGAGTLMVAGLDSRFARLIAQR